MLQPPAHMTRPQRALLFALGALLLLTALPQMAHSQIYVYPRRPTQSNVRYFDFDWYHIDILVGPEADTDGATPAHPERVLEAAARSLPSSQSATEKLASKPGSRTFYRDYFLSSPPLWAMRFPDPAEDTRTMPPPARRPSPDEDDDQGAIRFPNTDLTDRTGGVRLFFYQREEDVARRAAAFIEESYRDLVHHFRFVPTETLPYTLYNSYQEFLQTNIFPVQEGVLGVTGRRDLQLVLPYFGDHRLFQHISTHEMAHQFTIQKAKEVARRAGVSGDPLDRMPLWFIEGMAEYYSLGGLDSEAEMLTRDLLLNPDPHQGYVMLDFFEDRPFSSLWTYKVGQARIAFLEEVYGEGTVQDVMERSYRLIGRGPEGAKNITFRQLLADVTGDDRRRISGRFERWLKERSYSRFLKSAQDSADVVFYNDIRGLMQTMTTSPDGTLLLYRSIQLETGRVRLYLADPRSSSRHRQIARDGVPGVESLHPVGPRNFDLTNDKLAFIARSEGRDMLYLEEIDHQATRNDEGEWRVRLRTGKRRGYDLGTYGILAAESPAFSPDGRRVAFIGLDVEGQKDIYLFEAHERGDFIVSRLTNDEYAERGLAWGEEGIVFASDATGHGRYNLFRINLHNTGAPERLTFEENDHFDPRIMPDGRTFFSAFHESRANLYEWTPDGVLRHTDIVTGLFDVSPGPNSSVWAAFHHRGQRRAVRIAKERLLALEVPSNTDETNPSAEAVPSRELVGAEPYRASSLRNWRLNNAFGILGASSAGLYGQVMLLANDRLRNHALFVSVLAFGDLNNTMADLLYLNQERRLIWGGGLFQDVRYRVDRTVETESRFLSGERFYGARGTLRYPFNRFFFIQGDLSVGGVGFFLLRGTREFLNPPEVQAWDEIHQSHRFQTSPAISLGYNTLQYHPGTGPISGGSVLLESTLDLQPFDKETHGTIRLDGERYFPIYNRINLGLRTGMGTTFGGDLRRQFYLSSYDTLRGVEFGDIDYLLGDLFFFAKAEVRLPLNFLLRVPLIDIEGIVGADFGGTGDDLADLWRWRAFSPVTGFNFGLGPLVFRLHFALPIDIGAPRLPRDGKWITNFSLGWRYD